MPKSLRQLISAFLLYQLDQKKKKEGRKLTKGSSLENMWYLSSAAISCNKLSPLTQQWICNRNSSFTFFHSATTSSFLYQPSSWSRLMTFEMVKVKLAVKSQCERIYVRGVIIPPLALASNSSPKNSTLSFEESKFACGTKSLTA